MEVVRKWNLEELRKIFLTIIRKILRAKLHLLQRYSAVSLSISESNGRIS